LSKQLAEFRDIVHGLKQDVLTLKQQGHGSDVLTDNSDVLTNLPVLPNEPSSGFTNDIVPDKLEFASSPEAKSTLSEAGSLGLDSKVNVDSLGVNSKVNVGNPTFKTEEINGLNGIPAAYMSKAAELLNILKVDKDISWDTQGNLFLHNKLVSGVNFYDLFPKLFTSKYAPSTPGLQNLANFISTQGNGHFLHSFHTMGLILPKKRKLPEERHNIKKRLYQHRNWYYLGP
jgi:hypothetical protein